MAQYIIYNGPAPTTAAQVPVTTGTVIKTLLQVKPGATKNVKIKEWSISFDGSAAATPIKVELLETDVAATVTAHGASGIVAHDDNALMGGDPTTALIAVGTTATGFTATAEGSITASRMLDAQQVAPTNQYVKQWPLGEEPIIQVNKFGRIRVTAGVAVNAYCYIRIEV